MARVDLRVPFTTFPTTSGSAFPDRKTVDMPIARIALVAGSRSFEVPGLIDTGSSFTIFGTKHADALGINWVKAPTVTVVGLGRADNLGYVADVRLILSQGYYGWDARVVFCPAANSLPYGLLGHIGFLEHFEVRFKAQQKLARIFLS